MAKGEKGIKTIEGRGHVPYRPEHGGRGDPAEVYKPDLNRAGYVGMPDGVQSEGSLEEARELLGTNNVSTDYKGVRVRNPGGKAWYTDEFDAG